ncbi:hypothetical protein WA158_003100 [Blastocystis sp. Blastoise]
MTVYECLYFYGTIKGIIKSQLDSTIVEIMTSLGLLEHRNKLTGNLSGGNKRRLCVAIAFMGNPDVIIMDEPSTGLDPVSRHKLWSLITSCAAEKSFLLTTHLMEEADALCDRIGIIGYTFDVKVEDKPGNVDRVKEWVAQTFGSYEIRDEHNNHIIFVLENDVDPDECFEKVIQNITDLHIIDYTLSQATLDQVFLQFARHQESHEGKEITQQQLLKTTQSAF